MSEAGTLLAALLTSLEAFAPNSVCTRDFVPFEHRAKTELEKGVFTLIHKGGSDGDASTLDLLLIGQIKLGEKAAGSAIEEAEDLMMDIVRAWAERNTALGVQIRSWRKSMQIDRPFGWIAVDLVSSPVILTPDVDESTLSDFLLFHAEHSLAPGDDEPAAIDEVNLPQ
ncbi:MAG: hypothetical protein AB1450_08345 [Pseudomonadota bacterium]